MQRSKKSLTLIASFLVLTGSMALAGYTVGPTMPVTGDVNVKSTPLKIANLVDWTKADSPIYNGYTVLQNLPMGTTPTLVFHDFQSGYPTTL